jgi:hypothetical protein
VKLITSNFGVEGGDTVLTRKVDHHLQVYMTMPQENNIKQLFKDIIVNELFLIVTQRSELVPFL